MIGQIINYRYEVLEKIGDGDIFSVYKARDKVLNRLVALKFLTRECSDNVEFANAVRNGYNAAAVLDHPSIARVLDSDPTSQEVFVACEYVRGINVKDRVSRAGAMQVPIALDIMVPVLEALEYAHANRIAHGDLRAQDIVVSTDGEVKVTDFGISPALRAFPEVIDRFSMRSVHYEAPEIAEGAPPSASADIYSAGVILYEMLTGSLPFDGPTAVAVAVKQAKEVPASPRSLNTAVPKSLSDLVMRALEKSPDDRFPTAGAMLADLRAIRDALRVGRPVSVPQPSVSAPHTEVDDRADAPQGLLSRSSYLWLVMVFVVVILIVGGLTFHLGTRDSKIPVPYIIGMSVEEARIKARDEGFRIEIDGEGEVYSNDYEEGLIARQLPEPPARVVREKAIIRYSVSKGPSAKRVPDLTGMPETEAYRAAQEAGFTIGKVTREYSDTIPLDSVIRQDPEKGVMMTPESPIALVISLGVKPEPMSSDGGSRPSLGSQQRNFQVAVTVPSEAEGQQEVRIVVDDDRGESTAITEFHDPGDKFSQTITAYGDKVRIRVYVGGRVVSDERY